jgi:cytochrome c biogenesis protein CcdA
MDRPYPEDYRAVEWEILGRAVWFILGVAIGGILTVAGIYWIGF